MLFRRVSAAAVFAALAVAPASAAVNLVNNGSFETGVNPGGFTTLGAGSGSLTGWSVVSGTIDYIGSYWVASDGVRSLDLNGSGTAGVISQTISGLAAGSRYIVSFDLAGNPDGPPPIKLLDVTVDGNVTAFSFPVGGNTRSAMGWTSHSFDFVAAGTSTLLSFGPTGNAAGFYGPALDNVSVAAAVPEPATWAMMLIGFGGLGMLSMRRRRAMAV